MSDYDDDDYYEDEDEGMGYQLTNQVKDREAGIDFLRGYLREQSAGTHYAILSNLDGVFTVTQKFDKPCYGELRPYNKGPDVIHPLQVDTRGKDDKPGDLPGFFPHGKIEAVAVVKPVNYSPKELVQKFFDWTLSPEHSPWRKLLDKIETIYKVSDPGNLAGFLLHDTHIGPTPFIQMMMFLARIDNLVPSWQKIPESVQDDPLAPLVAWSCGSRYCTVTRGYVFSLNGGGDGYTLDLKHANLSRLARGEYYDIDGGVTLYDGAAYNRPNIHLTFGHGRKNDFFGAPTHVYPPPPAEPVDAEDLLVKLREAMAAPDDGDFSLSDKDPLQPIYPNQP